MIQPYVLFRKLLTIQIGDLRWYLQNFKNSARQLQHEINHKLTALSPAGVVLVFVFFTLANFLFLNNKEYLILCLITYLLFYICSKNLFQATWLTYLSTLLLGKAYYFQMPLLQFENMKIFQGPMATAHFQILFADGFLIILLYLLFRQRRAFSRRVSQHDLWLLPAILTVVASSWYSNLPETAWFSTYELIRNILMYLLMILVSNDRNTKIKTMQLLSIFILFAASLIILEGLRGGIFGLPVEKNVPRVADESRNLFRPSGFFYGPNPAASLFVMLLPMVLIFSPKLKSFDLRIHIFLLMALAVVFTASRTNWLLFLLLIWLLYQKKIKNNFQSLLDVLKKKWLLPLLLLAVIISAPIIYVRILTINKIWERGGAIAFRIFHIKQAMMFTVAKPVGIGLDNFQFEILNKTDKESIGSQTPAHNFLAEIITGTGVIGFFVFSLFFYKFAKQAVLNLWKGDFSEQWAVDWAILTYLVSAQFFTWFLDLPISAIFWLILGLRDRVSGKVTDTFNKKYIEQRT